MRLLIVAALIAVISAARLEHLERSSTFGYVPPDNNFGTNGFGSNVGSFGNGINSGNNELGNGLSGLSNGIGTNGQISSSTNGFGTNGRGSNGNEQSSTTFSSNGNGVSQATNSFGSIRGPNGFAGATSNQYLPPDQSSSGSGNTFSFGGSSIKPACPTCGQSGFSQQYNQASSSLPGTSLPSNGVPQFGSSLGSNGGSNLGTNFGSTSGSTGSTFGSSELPDSKPGSTFGSSNGNFGSSSFGSNSFGSQGFSGSQGGANRQYLPPRPSSQNPPQQPFDEKYGYIY